MTNLAQKKPTDEPADPIVQQSLLMPLTITVGLLVFSLAWMVFDEYYVKQAWRHVYQPHYLDVANDYWVVKQQEAEDRAALGVKLTEKLDAIDRKYEGSMHVAEDKAAEIIGEAKENYKDLKDGAEFTAWENKLIADLRAVQPPLPDKLDDADDREAAKEAAAEIKTLDKDILNYLGSRYLTAEQNKGSDADRLALIKTKLPPSERLALEAAGYPGADGAYDADTRAYLNRIALIKGIEYRIALRDKDYKDIDGLVTDSDGLRNERSMYLAELYLYDSGRDKSVVKSDAFLSREERVLRRAPAQQKLREEMNALNNERIAYEDPRINQRKTVGRLTADLDAIKGRITGIGSQQIDMVQRFVKNEGANNIVDRCESCHFGTDKAGMGQGELWRVSGVFVAANFMEKFAERDFFEELPEQDKLLAASELDGKSHENLDGVEFPTFKELADIAGSFDYAYDKATDDEGMTAFERRYGKGKRLDARIKAGYGLMALARAENFMRGDMGQLGQVPDDPAKILNDSKFVEKTTTHRLRVLYRYASRTFRTYVRENLLMFASHPDTHGLLDVHKPSEFGCTVCHEGQGRHISGDGLISIFNLTGPDKAHGQYHHSLWQLFKDGYYEAGCQMCHNKQIEMDGAPQLQAARDQFMRYGCWGCHKYEGFEPQADERMQVGKELGDLQARENTATTALDRAQRRSTDVQAAYMNNPDDKRLEDESKRLADEIQARSYELYEIQRQIRSANTRLQELETETKHVAPNLAQLAAKIEDKSWVARWVRYPKGFRPSTKMPHFFYGPFSYATNEEGEAEEDEFGNHVLNKENEQALKLIIAYVWQAARWSKERGLVGTPGGGNSYGVPVGDKASIDVGQKLFESRGCQGCHTAKPDIALGKDKKPMPVGKYLTAEGKPTMDVHEAARDKNGLLVKNEDVYSWAANLSREGEKNNPDYLVEWILQPRNKDPHSVMPSIWSAATEFQLSAASVAALDESIKAAFTKGGVSDYTKTDFYQRPETSFIPAELKLSGPEVAALRHDLTVAKCVREAKLVVAYLKSLVSPDKDALNAPQADIFKRTAGKGDAYAFMEGDGEFNESIVRDIEILPNGQKDAQSEESEPKSLKLKGYETFKALMNKMYDARKALDEARAGMSATLATGGNVNKFADAIVKATAEIRDARAALEGTFAGFGRKYVSNYGCATCHTIPGMEDEGKIGTELTYEGSKLIERLDFGLNEERPEPEDPKSASQSEFAPLMTRARGATLGGHGFELPEMFKRDFIKHKHDYETKLVWFTGKLYSPRQYDKGKRRSNWFERLRMPLFEMDDEEARLIGMFIAGSRETKLPQEKFIYQLKGESKVKADGWWLLRRYNCVGCHSIGRHDAHIRHTDLFSPGSTNFNLNTPPKLNDAGLRLNPSWAVAWLQQPHMIRHMQLEGDNSGYDLGLRMPNFGLTESEARTIVAFLASYAKAPQAYSAPPNVTLSQSGQDFAKAIIASEACNQCHEYREDVDGYRLPGGKAPNLGNAQERVRYQWVHGWVTNPDLIQPQTRMFRFFRTGPDGKSIFNDDPLIGGNVDYSKILKLDATGRWPQDQMPADPAAVLRDYVLFYYPKSRAAQDELQDLTRKFTDAKPNIK